MFVSKSMLRLMDDWRNFACRAHGNNKELLQLAGDINETNKKCLAFQRQLLDKLDDSRSEIDNLVYKLECLLCHATGNKLSKHTYDLRTMELAVNDYVEKCCDEARSEAKSKVIDEFASELKEYLDDTYSTGEDVLIDINDSIDYIAQKIKGGAE